MDWRQIAESLPEFAEKNRAVWNELDAAQGDGDLGVTLQLAANALADAAAVAGTVRDWLLEGGRAVRKAAPSTMGILLASALIAAGKALPPETGELSSRDWLLVQKTMAEEIMRRGGAQRGDKTVLDAFLPAIEAYEEGLEQNLAAEELMAKAAEAANRSAEATADMASKTGRSSWLGERASGRIDGGAWFCYQLYEWLALKLSGKA